MSPASPPRQTALPDPLWSLQDYVAFSRHSDPEVRLWALEWLAELFGHEADEAIGERLADPDEMVARAAAHQIGRRRLMQYADHLLARYEESTGALAIACAHTLGLLGEERLLQAFRRKLHRRKMPPLELQKTWLALAHLSSPEAHHFLREAVVSQEPAQEPEAASSLFQALLHGEEPEDVAFLAGHLLERYERYTGTQAFEAFLHFLGDPSTGEEFKEDLKSRLFRKLSPLEGEALRRLQGWIDAGSLSVLKQALRWRNYGKAILLTCRAAGALIAAHPLDHPPQGHLAFLRALEERLGVIERIPRPSQREVAALSLLALVEVGRRVEAASLRLPEEPSAALQSLLSGDYAPFPEVEESLLARLSAVEKDDAMVRSCLDTLQGPSPGGAVHAARLLGAWRASEAIPALLDSLSSTNRDEALVETAGEALIEMGEAALEGIGEVLRSSDDLGKIIGALEVLEKLPCRRSVEILLEQFERLWILEADALLETVQALGARDFLQPLKRELREGEALAENVYLFLCQLHKTSDPILKGIRKRKEEREVALRRMLKAGDMSELLTGRLPLALKCRGCSRTYTYEVTEIYIDPEQKVEPFIRDEIRCKGCGRLDDYELTSKARMAIMAEMMKLLAAKEKLGEKALDKTPLRFVAVGLSDGRRMSPGEALKEYEGRIAKDPHDPGLQIGYANVLRFLKKFDRALEAYRKALEMDPLAVEAHASIAEILADREDFAGAYEAMRRCVDLLPQGHFYRTQDRKAFTEGAREALAVFRKQGAIRLPEAKPKEAITARVGRNAPCPCGSGRKYKKCCLGKEAVPQPRPSGAEARLRERLLEYAQRALPYGEFERALSIFWKGRFDPRKRLLTLEEEEGPAFLEWLVYDYRLKTGRTVVEQFLIEQGNRLPPEERAILQEWQDTAVSLYEVTAVEPGVGLALQDVFSGKVFQVRDIRGSQRSAKWDLLAARLIRVHGIPELAGTAFRFPPSEKEEILRFVRKRYEAYQRAHPEASFRDFLKAEGLVFREFAEGYRDRPLPTFLTYEGHPLIFAKGIYELKDPRRVIRALREAEDFDKEEGEGEAVRFTWLRLGPSEALVEEAQELPERGVQVGGHLIPGHGAKPIPSLGQITLSRNRLTLECLSRERLGWGKRRLETLLGDAIAFKADLFESVERRLEQAPPFEKGEEAPEVPPKVEAEILADFLYNHYTRWLETPLPALDGFTPRQAAQSPERREKLEQLLREMENAEDQKRILGKVWYNLRWLREELGMG